MKPARIPKYFIVIVGRKTHRAFMKLHARADILFVHVRYEQLPNVDTLSSNPMAAWAAAESSCSKQRQARHAPLLSRLAGKILRDFSRPNLAQTTFVANLRLCSFRNGGKPFFSALFMFGPAMLLDTVQIGWSGQS